MVIDLVRVKGGDCTEGATADWMEGVATKSPKSSATSWGERMGLGGCLVIAAMGFDDVVLKILPAEDGADVNRFGVSGNATFPEFAACVDG